MHLAFWFLCFLPLPCLSFCVPPEILVSCRKKGFPAITDANLVLGRILPEFFPSIFGEDEKQPLDAEAAKEALKKITDQVNEQSKSSGQADKSVEEVKRPFGLGFEPTFCLVCLSRNGYMHAGMLCCDTHTIRTTCAQSPVKGQMWLCSKAQNVMYKPMSCSCLDQFCPEVMQVFSVFSSRSLHCLSIAMSCIRRQ